LLASLAPHRTPLSHLPRHHPFLCLHTATAPTQIDPLSLHDALPISRGWPLRGEPEPPVPAPPVPGDPQAVAEERAGSLPGLAQRSEEHTSELQSRENLVCRLLLEKKNPAASTGGQPPSS